MKLLAKIIIAVAIFVAGFYVGGQQALSPSDGNKAINQPLEQNQKETIIVSLMLDFGNGQVRTFNDVSLAKDAAVFALLEKVTSENNLKLSSKDYGELGVFVEGVGDIKNSIAGDKYWQYWVNNKYAEIGASAYNLNDGDFVEWKYIKGQIN